MRRFSPLFFGIVVISADGAAHAEERMGDLWQGISAGDSVSEVSDKLATIPDVKKVRIKDGSISIKYKGRGVSILGQSYKIVPQFEEGRLERISLATRSSCVSLAVDRYDPLIKAMTGKYPEKIVGPRSRSDMIRAKLTATASRSVDVATVLGNEATAAFIVHRFTTVDPPPPLPFGANDSMRAASRFLWSQYDQRAAECDGDGVHRVSVYITYLTREDLSFQLSTTQKEMDEEISEAADKL